jgi:hypothetical protein
VCVLPHWTHTHARHSKRALVFQFSTGGTNSKCVATSASMFLLLDPLALYIILDLNEPSQALNARHLRPVRTVLYRACMLGHIIKLEITAAFHCIYNLTTGPLPSLNGAVLTLLPKTEVAEQSGEFYGASRRVGYDPEHPSPLVITSPPPQKWMNIY